MQGFKTIILAGLCGILVGATAFAQTQRGDDAILAMSEAAKQDDGQRLRALLRQAGCYALEHLG